MEASVSRQRHKIRVSYDVPHRVFASRVYPLQAPNGSTVIVYGHEQGIRIVWRGGRSFRSAPAAEGKPSVNGTSKEDPMVLDSDEDELSANAVPFLSDFEVEEDESDTSEPYNKILRHIDVQCGTGVRHLAIPQIPVHLRESAPGAFPPILLSNIVLAAACNDASIRLITLPLLPPQPSRDETSSRNIQVVTIAGTNTHREVPSSIAITHSVLSSTSGDERGSSTSRSRSRNRSAGDGNKSPVKRQSGTSWCFLLVSISPSAGGLLLTHQVPLDSDTQLSRLAENLPPIQRCYLGLPCSTSKLVFNPSPYPSSRHSTLLLSTAESRCAKLYQVSFITRSNTSRGRKDSAATTDPTSSALNASFAEVEYDGRFLITLYPGFIRSSNALAFNQRKNVLDVAWVANGRAIIVLLEDGEWGIWDLEGVGPRSGSANLLRGQSNMSGIQGGSLTKFALCGRVTPSANAIPKSQKAEISSHKDETLAPMTPHTRKVRNEGLFKGNGTPFGTDETNSQLLRGSIGVMEHGPLMGTAISAPEESVLLVHGSNANYISSLQALWRFETRNQGTLASVDAVRPSPISDLDLDDETLIAVEELPRSLPANMKASYGTTKSEKPDLLIVADHRLNFIVSPVIEPAPTEGTTAPFSLRLGKAQESSKPQLVIADQALLGQGELDLEGMDRILEGMDHNESRINGNGALFGKNVAFDLDEDEEFSMMSPTPKANGRPRRRLRSSTGKI